MTKWRWRAQGLVLAAAAATLGCGEDASPVRSGEGGAAGQTAQAVQAGQAGADGALGGGQGGAGETAVGGQGNESGSNSQQAGVGGSSGADGQAAGTGPGGAAGTGAGSARITFEDLGLSAASYWNGSDGSGAFESGFGVFANQYDSQWDSWSGFAYSSETDTQTADFSNQYSAAPGAGAEGSTTYAVAYRGAERPRITFLDAGDGLVISGAAFANTTYTALTLRDGSAFSEPFGGTDGSAPDWFLVEAYGVTESGGLTGPVSVYLADFRSDDVALDRIETGWRWVSLAELGPVVGLEFELSSSDTGEYGMNTPAYFALDDITRE